MNITQNVFLLGYGAIGKCFTEILLKNHPSINLIVWDMIDVPQEETRFKYIKKQILKENISSIMEYLQKGDILVDLSTNIDVVETWTLCAEKGVMYLNTAMEEWEDCEDAISFPQS